MPETKFTKEYIMEKAIEIVKINGIDALTARGLASKIKSSVAPIYDNYGNIDKLKDELFKELYNIHMQMLTTKYTEGYFLNVGIGTIKFANEYNAVFNDYLRKSGRIFSLSSDNQSLQMIFSQMRMDNCLSEFSDEDLLDILMKMEIFTHGVANLSSLHLFPKEYKEDYLFNLLEETGDAIILHKITERNHRK